MHGYEEDGMGRSNICSDLEYGVHYCPLWHAIFRAYDFLILAIYWSLVFYVACCIDTETELAK
jgi:hypothetical protein